MKLKMGKWTEEGLDRILLETSRILDSGERIASVSRQFLGTTYQEHTLIGDRDTPEVLVVDLGGLDCFTFIDYIEAMRMSGSFSEFLGNLQKVRYKGGRITFEDRNHFFTDWRDSDPVFAEDVTWETGGAKAIKLHKVLNVKGDGAAWVPGIRSVEREIAYIPSDAVDEEVLGEFRTGDYAGIYSDAPGLDVSHVGIIIKGEGNIYLRHASLRHRKVVDERLSEYISGRPGLIILRPRPVIS